MIKRSAILLLFLVVSSFSLLLYASYNSDSSLQAPPLKESNPAVKCSGPCPKKNNTAVPWNFISPAMFQHQG